MLHSKHGCCNLTWTLYRPHRSTEPMGLESFYLKYHALIIKVDTFIILKLTFYLDWIFSVYVNTFLWINANLWFRISFQKMMGHLKFLSILLYLSVMLSQFRDTIAACTDTVARKEELFSNYSFTISCW